MNVRTHTRRLVAATLAGGLRPWGRKIDADGANQSPNLMPTTPVDPSVVDPILR